MYMSIPLPCLIFLRGPFWEMPLIGCLLVSSSVSRLTGHFPIHMSQDRKSSSLTAKRRRRSMRWWNQKGKGMEWKEEREGWKVCSPEALTAKKSRFPNGMAKEFVDQRGSCMGSCIICAPPHPLDRLETEVGYNFHSTFHSPFSAVEFSLSGTTTSLSLQEPGMNEISSKAKSPV